MPQLPHPRTVILPVLALFTAAALAYRPPSTTIPLQHPDQRCARCHQAIYDSYQQTAKAHASGLALPALIPGTFTHAPSGITYQVFAKTDEAVMSYNRLADSPKGELHGQRQLELFVGSGHRGRTYLYRQDTRWYELPINFYTRRNTWAMAPAYDNAQTMPAPLPVDPNCLHCHATDIQPSLPNAKNRFATTPFLQGGIGCNACHGDPAQHLAQQGHGAILNPARMPVAQRDSACIQCHLEGDAVVYRPGKSLAKFEPGQDLADTAVYFVKASSPGTGARATSQYEALLRSACKRVAGDKLTCTTCHDPHFTPAAADRVQYYRAKCLTCHTAPAIAQTHHPEQPDCAKCHMLAQSTTDISHEQVTDHDIEAHPSLALRPIAGNRDPIRLVPVGNAHVTDRETGLAYAQFVERGDPNAARTALALLSNLSPADRTDPDVALELGYLQQLAGTPEKAREAYRTALLANPWQPAALANLAVIDAGTNRIPEAIRLLERLIAADPTQTAAGLNLAILDCATGHQNELPQLLARLEDANPDAPQLRRFKATGEYANQHCSVAPTPTITP
jgi:predicted CXXCH cytochrome family protein